jgi:tetratricopeptide (TPR) repeat protein
MAVQLFLSCVSNEFGAYRDPLRKALTRPDVEVKIQEDFKPLGGDTLAKLDEYIAGCEAVVHFVGDAAGSSPTDFCVGELLARRPDIKARLPPLGADIEAGKAISYTQWEAWLALLHRKDLVIAARETKSDPTKRPDSSQIEHRARLKEVGRYFEVKFTSEDNLVAQIYASAVLKALVKAARSTPVHQPRNLPYISLEDLFVGRELALGELRAALVGGKGQAALAGRALHGLGGIGKTRLAIEYAWLHQAAYSAILFVRADDPAKLNANLAALAGADVLNLKERDESHDDAKIAAAVRWLDGHPTWLMILDNVDDEEAVAAVAKQLARLKNGHFVVTGRAANFPAGVRKIELGVLDEDSATKFLLGRTAGVRDPADDDALRAKEIANKLGRLALGLEQAGAYIATERIGFRRYLVLWRDSRETVVEWFDKTLTSYDHDTGLAATWATSVWRLTRESRRLLDRLAMLAPDPIPDSLLDVAVPGEGESLWTKITRVIRSLAGRKKPIASVGQTALARLFAYSLITRASGEGGVKGFTVHRLVQDFARRAMAPKRAGKALRGALAWLNAAFVGDPSDVRSWPLLDPLAPHAHAVARWADEAGIAEPTVRLVNQLALLLIAKARYAEAEPLFRRALAIVEASYGPDHPHMASVLNGLALWLKDMNRLGEAEPLIRRALNIDEARYGPDHPEVATDLNNLAGVVFDANRLDEAEGIYRRALNIYVASYGPNHPNVAIGLNNLAALLRKMTRFGEAKLLLQRALEIDEASFGSNHPKVATRLNNLAELLRATNRLGEAEQYLRRAVAIDEASYGPNHPNVAIDLNNLAGLLRDTNRLGEADPLLRRALAIFEASYGPDHPLTSDTRYGVAALNAALR